MELVQCGLGGSRGWRPWRCYPQLLKLAAGEGARACVGSWEKLVGYSQAHLDAQHRSNLPVSSLCHSGITMGSNICISPRGQRRRFLVPLGKGNGSDCCKYLCAQLVLRIAHPLVLHFYCCLHLQIALSHCHWFKISQAAKSFKVVSINKIIISTVQKCQICSQIYIRTCKFNLILELSKWVSFISKMIKCPVMFKYVKSQFMVLCCCWLKLHWRE